jgi:transposase
MALLQKDYNVFVGIDVHKKSYAFTVRDNNGKIRSKKIPADIRQFYAYIRRKDAFSHKVICAYEAGPTGFHVHDFLTKRGIPCLVVPPYSIRKACNERVKNDKIDSAKIAKDLEDGELESIRVPMGNYRELRNLVKIRDVYARNRSVAKQRIKAFLLSSNLYEKLREDDRYWTRKYLNELREVDCSYGEKTRLNMLLSDLDYAREQLLSVHREMKGFCEKDQTIAQYIRFLRSIPGIGFTTAVTILGTVGDPVNLKNVRELGSYVGLVPTEYSSGEKINKGRITRLGNKSLRFMLIEAAWIAIKKDTELAQFYHRIRARHHPKIGARKATVAVARKLTQRIYRVLRDQREYITH